MTLPLTEPFPGPPSAAIQAGYCPGCGGTGRVDRSVPQPDIYPCSTCGGDGAWPPLDWRTSELPGWLDRPPLIIAAALVAIALVLLAAQVARWVL